MVFSSPDGDREKETGIENLRFICVLSEGNHDFK